LKIQDNGGRHIGNSKKIHLSNDLTNFYEIWYGDSYGSSAADRLNLEFLKIHDGGRRRIGTINKMQYLSSGLTDRHEI